VTLEQSTLTKPAQPGWNGRGSRKGGWSVWTKAVALPLAAGFAGTTALLTLLRWAPLPDPSALHPTLIDSQDGQRLAEWSERGARAERVPLPEIPLALQQATLAVEDARFYDHGAFDLPALTRALWMDVRHGRIVEGGSTITQQLAKNLFLTQDRTLVRKLKEALYAMQLELHESKRTILEQYLNAVYYGHGAYGVRAAAQLYFGKQPKDLSLAECALLAGLPRGPSLYSPYLHMNAAKERQRWVLQRMVALGMISQAQADAAYAEPLHLAPQRPAPATRAPYFTSVVLREAERRFALSSDDLHKGGLHLTTTLDPVLQSAAERAIASTLPAQSGIQAALVAIDPRTGAIRAMVGGRDFAHAPYNRALAQRQPGSTFKAVLYTAALASGWTPARQVNSEPTTFLYDQSRIYSVHDYGDFYAHRPLTMREAIARSDNVYAVTCEMDIGPQTVIRTARQLGIHAPLRPYPSLALGVFPVSPLEMAAAYATLANGGQRVQPYAIQRVEFPDKPPAGGAPMPPEQVIAPELAFQVTDLLTSVLSDHGTGAPARAWLRGPAAAKTGTTDTDAWMVGYTPNLVCAVWVGYDDNRHLSTAESHLAAPIWGKFMGAAQQHLPGGWYTPPPGLVRRTIDPLTGTLATDACPVREDDWFLPGTEPSATCLLHPQPEAPAGSDAPWYRRWARSLPGIGKWL
jgi:1A family penicillin-binding protein